jgi:hypothetical protein
MTRSPRRPGRLPRRTALAAALLLGLLAAAPAARAGEQETPAQKYALLVGCTEYQYCKAIPPLDGPGNDVPRVAALLEGLGFPKGNITRLVGWPDDVKARPSYANIVAALDGLANRAGPGSQVFILLSGHGVAIPIPESRKAPLDPKNPKLDGTDKVFLPADVKEWNNDKLDNALMDYQIGRYLDRMAARGAAVWIILDCCHSGTMARDAEPGDVERSREVRARDLKIPDRAFEDAARRAQGMPGAPPAGEKTRSVSSDLESGMLHVSPRQAGKGSVVAFYACQPFEKAPELPRPSGAAAVQKNYYGLMSYTLTSLLQANAKSRITYRELAQMLVSNYEAERGSRSPTPFAEGDLDREVLGMAVWPKRAHMILEPAEGKLRVSGGEVITLTPGSVLAVHPPAGDKRDPKTVLGHVTVVGLTPFQAEVAPAAFAGAPAVAADMLPARARCTLVSQDLGDMRLKVAVGKAAAGAAPGPAQANIAAAVGLLPDEVKKLVAVTDDPARADWVLWVVGDRVELRQGDGRATIDPRDDQALRKAAAQGKPVSRVVYGKYDAGNPRAIADGLGRDLQRIYTWRNVWRVAGSAGARPEDDADLQFEVVKLKDKTTPDGKLEPGAPVLPGQRIEVRVKNSGRNDLWVTVLFLDANYGIDLLYSDALQSGRPLRPIRGTISKTSAGKEGFVVLAVPLTVQKMRPDFTFLAQAALGREEVITRDVRLKKVQQTPQTPFERLMAAAALGGRTRDFQPDVPTNPAVLSWSWTTLPVGTAAPPRP